MPATSKAQFKFMKSVASGTRKAKGLSRQQAGEFIAGQTMKGLPKRAKGVQTNSKKKKGKK